MKFNFEKTLQSYANNQLNEVLARLKRDYRFKEEEYVRVVTPTVGITCEEMSKAIACTVRDLKLSHPEIEKYMD